MDRGKSTSEDPRAAQSRVLVHTGADGVRRVEATDLFAGHREVVIAHADQCYRLRVTANGKLILTK
jgi:hemin uptake protein HemP